MATSFGIRVWNWIAFSTREIPRVEKQHALGCGNLIAQESAMTRMRLAGRMSVHLAST